MPTLFYEIFNKQIKLEEAVVAKFLEELEMLFYKFKEHDDVDYVKVLKNKLEHLLEHNKPKKGDKKAKKAFKQIDEFIEKISTYIQEASENEQEELIDVVKGVDKRYKKCEDIKPEKRDKYRAACIKKSKIKYEKEIIKLQVELLKLQRHIKETGEKLLIIFEGRDAAGKGGTIKRFREYLNPRGARVMALEKPTDMEKSQWYFQRYVPHLPSAGEMVFFDRSWYNRAGVEPVMGFVSKSSYEQFLDEAPKFEKMLQGSGIKIVKFYFSVSKTEQAKRFDERRLNPLKQYKLSPIDQDSQKLWEKYTLAEYNNFTNTHSKDTPWTIVNSDDKKQARINAIKHVLNMYDYPDKISDEALKIDTDIVYPGSEKAKILKQEIDINGDLFE